MSDNSGSQADADGLRKAVRKVSPSVTMGMLGDTVRSSGSPVDLTLVDESSQRLPSWRSHAGVLVKVTEDAPTRPTWLRTPCTYSPAVDVDNIDLATRLNVVFTEYFDNNEVPTLSAVVGACGYSSIVQMCNDARRKGPERMRLITRALTAMSTYYEQMAASGNRIALSILERIPQFDDLEAPTQVATRAFAPQPQEHIVHLKGLELPEDRGKHLSPLDAYNQIITARTFEDISAAIELEEGEDGVFDLPHVAHEANSMDTPPGEYVSGEGEYLVEDPDEIYGADVLLRPTETDDDLD